MQTKLTCSIGTIGLIWRGRYQGDIFRKPYFGLYRNDGNFRRWYKLPFGKLLKVQVISPENARKVFGRTMRPGRILITTKGERVEAVSFPFINDLCSVRIMVRTTPGDPTTMQELPCHFLRPINFGSAKHFPPAFNPIQEAK